jgi:hypothetical protein
MAYKCKGPKHNNEVSLSQEVDDAMEAPAGAANEEIGVPAPVAYPGPPFPGPPVPGAGCSGAMAKKECLHLKGCVWCVSGFGPYPVETCYDEIAAKSLPPMAYKCKGPKKTSTGDVDDVVSAE